MPTVLELADFINDCCKEMSAEEKSSVSPSHCDELSVQILAEMQTRPIPSIELMNQSMEMKPLFIEIIREYIQFLKTKQEQKEQRDQLIVQLQESISCNEHDPEYYTKLNAVRAKLKTMIDSRIFTRIEILNMTQKTNSINSLRFNKYLSNDICPDNVAQYQGKMGFLNVAYTVLESSVAQDKQWRMSEDKNKNLAKASLRLYSARYIEEAQKDCGAVHIIHFYEGKNKTFSTEDRTQPLCSPRSSEFLDCYDSDDNDRSRSITFDKTSHGLGSGVYGLGSLTEDQICEAIDERQDDFKIFKIENPLRLVSDTGGETDTPSTFSELSLDISESSIDVQEAPPSSPGLYSFQPLESYRKRSASSFSDLSTTEIYSCDRLSESDQLTQLSKYLQRVGDSVKNQRLSATKGSTRAADMGDFFSNPIHYQRLFTYAQILCDFDALKKRSLSVTDAYDLLLCSMKEWFSDAHPQTAQLVPMPINYVIKKLGYTGIISSRNDTFNRGLIDMEPVSDDGEMILKVTVKRAVRSSNSALWDTSRTITPFKNGAIGELMSLTEKTGKPAPL